MTDNNFDAAVLLLEEQNTVQASCALLPLLLETRSGTDLFDRLQIIRDQAAMLPDNPFANTIFALCDYYELLFEIRTQPGGLDAITPTQIADVFNFSEIEDQIQINNLNILEYLEESEFHELKLIPIDFGPIQKAPTFFEEEPQREEVTNNSLNLYPNPARAELHIRYEINDQSDHANIEIFSLTGKKVFTKRIYDQQNELVLRIDGYTAGLYLVQIMSENGVRIIEKLIIQ
ncbi:T9SS type A sorting domain-containing protein [Crocinitomix catalasitica]|nr:T9SS type A sorting domain-containing protein [Crocinitomix catalasitica]